MKQNEKEKYYATYIKSAQGSLGLVLILNIIYTIRFFIKKEFDFFFSLYTAEFMLKCGGFAEGYEKVFPAAASIAGVIFVTLVFIMLTAFCTKKTGCIKYGFGIYLIDTAFLIYGAATNPFGDVNENVFVDIIFHFITLLLLVVGIYAERKSRKIKDKD